MYYDFQLITDVFQNSKQKFSYKMFFLLDCVTTSSICQPAALRCDGIKKKQRKDNKETKKSMML